MAWRTTLQSTWASHVYTNVSTMRELGAKQMRSDGGDIKELVMGVCGSTSPTRGGIGSKSTSNSLRGLFERLSKRCSGGGFCIVIL